MRERKQLIQPLIENAIKHGIESKLEGGKITINGKLENNIVKILIDGLNPNEFWRIHRATIVNVRTILNAQRSFTGKYTIKFKDIKDYLIVSRAYSHLFKHM